MLEAITATDFNNRYSADIIGAYNSQTLLPVMNRVESYQFVHILCFYMHEYDLQLQLATIIPKSIKGLGKYAARIKDVRAFVDLFFEKIKFEGLYGLMDPVQYHQPDKKVEYMDYFDKCITHRDEYEWRLALLPDLEKAKKVATELRQMNTNTTGSFSITI